MKKIFKILITITSILLIISCSNNNKTDNTALSENTSGVIRVATPGMHPLFSRANAEGKLEGYDIDVWEEIGRRLNKKIEWQQISLSGAFGSVDAGKADTVSQQISITPGRMEKYYFSEPYFLSPYKLYVAETNNSINKIEDMYGKKIGITIGSSSIENIKRLDPENKIEIVSFNMDSIATIPNDVASGKLDASQEAVVVFDALKEQTGAKIKLTGDPIFIEINAFPFRKDESGKKLCDEVSKVIVEMREGGTLEKLAVKWFGNNPMEGLDFQSELDKLLSNF